MHLFLILSILLLALSCAYLCIRIRTQKRQAATTEYLVKKMLCNVDAYVLLIDADFNVLHTNYYLLTGAPESSSLLKVGNLLHCQHGEDAGECGTHALCANCPIRATITQAYHTKNSFSALEAPITLYTSPDRSSAVNCEVSVTGNYLSIEDVDHMLLTIHDITRQKKIQQELTEARLHAEESDRMKSLFLANTSHELRTPLNAIVGFSELLITATDATPSEREEYTRIIRTNNELLLQLINDILDLSKIEAGTLEYIYADEELDSIMEELKNIYEMKLGDDVRLIFRKPARSHRLDTDRKRLSQVLSNFLSNAYKYTTQGEIIFGYEVREAMIYFYVTDTGVGIPQNKINGLFERFVKVNRHKQGAGIGLAISKSIIESMGGEIGVESQHGQGSTFWFTLPLNSKH